MVARNQHVRNCRSHACDHHPASHLQCDANQRFRCDHTAEPRKSVLVDLGSWAVTTSCGWLVRAVHAAIEREGLHLA
jgi:hypothetical protein